ncbi:actin-binding Rho-activating protein [Stigmatopora nigra]
MSAGHKEPTSPTAGEARKEPPSFKGAVRKVRCAAAVAGLAKSWQGWAERHSDKQDSAPAGWAPSSVEREDDDKERRRAFKVAPAAAPLSEDAIRGVSVSRTVRPKVSERGGDAVEAIRGKMESAEPARERTPFLGNESPQRRRQMRALRGSGVVGERKSALMDANLGSRSSSLETEDSGLGDEVEAVVDIKCPKAGCKVKVTTSDTGDIKSRWQRWSEEHAEGQRLNPFSQDFDYDYAMSLRLRKGDSGYGRPKEGSKTAERGERAHRHVRREMEEMVRVVGDVGYRDRRGRTAVTFGRLFDRYVKISDKVVGILLRCRKHGMLDFEGEMLWKGRDDHVVITVRE